MKDYAASSLPQTEKQLEALALDLLDLAAEQKEALLRGNVDSLSQLSQQRQALFDELTTALAKAPAAATGAQMAVGTTAQRGGRLNEIVRQILELDSENRLLLESAIAETRAEMEKTSRGRLALHYYRRPSPATTTVDLVR